MTTPSLDWTYDDALGCEVAEYRGLRIRAVRDEHANDPLLDSFGHWPMLVRLPDRSGDLVGTYESPDGAGVAISTPFNGAALSSCRTPDQLLVHDQRAFAAALGFKTWEAFARDYLHDIDGNPQRYCRDADVLRDALVEAMGDMETNDRMEALAAIYKLLGVPYLATTVTGYSQGDWAELFIVAVPELQRKYWGADAVRSPDQIMAELQSQADLYNAWAFGDVYGYVIERFVGDQPCEVTEDEGEWCEIEDGSCWGYYGTDHVASGLEEAAIEVADLELAPA